MADIKKSRPGRKALFTGAPRKKGTPDPEDSNQQINSFIDECQTVLETVREGNQKARLDEKNVDESFRPLAVAVNSVLEKAVSTPEKASAYRILFEDHPLPMLISDADLRITDLNQAYSQLSGQSRKDLIGKEMKETSVFASSEDLLKKIGSSKQISEEIEIQREGRTQVLRINALRISDTKSKTASIVVVCHDITKEMAAKKVISSQEETISRLNKKTEILDEKQQELYKLRKSLKDEHKTAEAAIGEKETEIQTLKKQISELKTDKGTRSKENSGALEELKARLLKQEEALQEKEKKHSVLENQLHENLSQLQKSLEDTENDAKSAISGKDEEITSLREQISGLKAETRSANHVKDGALDELKARLLNQEEALQGMEAQKADLETELHGNLSQLQKSLDDTESNAKAALSDKDDEITNLREQIAGLKADKDTTVRDNTRALEELKARLHEQEEALQKLERHKTSLETELRQEIRELRISLKDTDANAKSELSGKDDEITVLKAEISGLNAETEILEANKAEMKELRQEIVSLREEREDLTSRIQAIEASGSGKDVRLQEQDILINELKAAILNEKTGRLNETQRLNESTRVSEAFRVTKEGELKEKDALINDLQEKADSLNAEVLDLRESAESLDSVKESLLRDYETKITELRNEHENSARRHESVIHDLEGETESFRIRASQAENKLAAKELETEGRHLKELEGLQGRIQELNGFKNRHEALMYNIPTPVVLTDTRFRILDVNSAYENMTGFSRQKLQRMSLRDFRVTGRKGEDLEKLVRSRQKVSGEITVEFSGSTHILEQHGLPVTDDKRNLTGIFVVCNDVTARQREEEEAREKIKQMEDLRKRSETIVQQNPMPILLVDKKYNVVVTNEAYVSMSGISMRDILRMNARDFHITEQKGEGLGKVVRENRRSYGEVTVELPNGTHILEQYGIPIINNQNEIANILIVYNDVTVVRSKEEELHRLMQNTQDEAACLSRSAQQITDKMALMAKGDLTASVEIFENDPLKALKENYNSALSEIKNIIHQVNQDVLRSQTTADELSKNSDDIGNATGRLATGTQGSADFSRDLLTQLEDVNKEISDLSASIEEIASTSQEVREQTHKVTEEGVKGVEIGNEAHDKMELVGNISEQSVEEITALNTQMHQINKIIKLITGIADQTNLLALNAAIEAARAGEHGRGFAVVAGEIRNLAKESKEAGRTIEDLITAIQVRSDHTVDSMSKSDREIRDGIRSVNSAIEVLNSIVTEVGAAANGIAEITKATEDQAMGTTRVMQSMESSTQLTKGNMKRTEDMAALSQEISASTEEVAGVAHEMKETAESLKKSVGAFRLN